jgi:3-oxoacyl-[acyl-carrier protein] reductase
MNNLAGKIAIVTGASRGIGAGIAKEFALHGASVVVNYGTGRSGADAVVKEISARGGTASAIHADVSNSADVERLFSETIKAYGKLDVLVNNAAVYVYQPVEEVDEAGFLRHFTINVLSDILTTQQAIKYFGSQGGSIINLTSMGATNPPMYSSVYSATKGAINSLTLELAKELGPRRIRVNALASGATLTEGAEELGLVRGNEFAEQFVELTPLGRLGEPEDIAKVAVFLASDESRWVTGDVVKASGGLI